MKWELKLQPDGIYYFEAKTPVGDLIAEYPDPMRVSDWEARWYPDVASYGVVIATAPTAEDCKAAAVKALRRKAQAWARALK